MTYHFRLFFSNNYNGNKYISLQDLHDPRGVIFQNFQLVLIGPMKVEWWMLYINLVCFFSTKTMRIIKSILGIVWENTTPSTEFLCDFCVGIGPLQLGVVLVFFLLFVLTQACSLVCLTVYLSVCLATTGKW